MKYIFLFGVCFSAFSFTLEEGFTYLAESERVKIALISYERALNNEDTLKSAILPSVSLNSSYTKTSYEDDRSDADSKTLALSLSQPLFRGLREFNALEASKFLSQSKNLAKESLLRDMKSQFATQYFSLLALMKERELTNQLVSASKNRLSEIEYRVRIGKSKKADLFQARSQFYVAESALSEIDSKIEVAFVNLSEVAGREIKKQSLISPNLLEDLNQSVLVENHPTLKNIDLLKEIARLDLKSSKAEHLPTVDLKGNYYLGGEEFNQSKTWDASLNLNMPIYTGGGTSAKVTDKAMAINEIEYSYLREKRVLTSKLQSLEVDFKTGKSRINLLKNAKDSLKTSYEEIQREYNLGLVTNLDVIQSLNQYIDAEKNYYRTFYQIQSSAYAHKILTENLL